LEVEREIVRDVDHVVQMVARADASSHDVVLFLVERGGQASYEAVHFAD